MTFEHSWVLLFALIPIGWGAYAWGRTAHRLGLILKVLTICAVIAAVAEPRIFVPETKVATAVLVDTSASVTSEDLGRASDLVARMERERGRNWLRVVPFARAPRQLGADEVTKKVALRPAPGPDGRATDIESAVQEGFASLPTGMIPRLAIISDGNENHGSVARAAWLAQQLHVPVDTFALAGRQKPTLRIDSVSYPTIAFTGEKFPIEVTVASPAKTQGAVELSADGKSLGRSQVMLQPGTNQLRVHASVNVAGAVDVSGVVKTADAGDVRFEEAITVRKPRVLYISQDPPGTEVNFMQTLAAAKFDVDRTGDPMHGLLADYQLVIFNNWDLENLPAARKTALQDYVRQGGGLLVIGGEKNVYAQDKKVEDALDETLPAKLAPPRSPEGTCVVLIIDKSSSMEGRKMELARLAAIGVIENLRPTDLVGVLIFDNSFQWAVPIRHAEDRSLIKRLISGITPDGGTQIAPALTEAYRKALPQKATFRHIVLLTDGISEEGDSLGLSREAASQRVTISTVGLGQDVNRAYLEKVATLAKGKSYFLTDPSGLEQILLKDVMEHTGSTAIEKPIVPTVVKSTDVLNGIDMTSAPPLRGYVKFTAKPTADTILALDQKDPLLASWQYGLGRSAVFTSDAKSRWAEKWISWPGFDRFWVNVTRDLLPHSQSGEANVAYDSATGKLKIDYSILRDGKEPPKIPDVYVFGPDKFQKAVPIQKTADGAYHGEIAIGAREGLFRIRPLEESRLFPETGLYRTEEEMNDFGSNEAVLKQISSFTGGRFNPAVVQVFDPGGRSLSKMLELWPGLLGAAVLLNLIELVMRKWKGIVEAITRRPA